jgi:hypothetical protein
MIFTESRGSRMREYVLDKLGINRWSLRTGNDSVAYIFGQAVSGQWTMLVESAGGDAAFVLAEAIGRVIGVDQLVAANAVEGIKQVGACQRVLVLGQKIYDCYQSSFADSHTVCMCPFTLDEMLMNADLKAELWRKMRPLC